MVFNKQKGFTLIELLVVIAIIGILASVVLASLNTARDRGNDAAAQAEVAQMRAEAELEAPDGDYSGICTAGGSFQGLYDSAVENAAADACNDSADAWAASVDLSEENSFFCADSTGFSGETSATLGSATSCN